MSSKVYPYTHPSITPVISLSIRHLPVYDQLFANGGEEGNVGLAPILLIKWPGSFRLDRFRALQPEPSTNRSCSYTSATISSSSSSDSSSSDSSTSSSSLSSSLTSVVLCRRWPRGMRESKHDLKKFRNLFMFAVPITIKSTQGRHLREEHDGGETTKSVCGNISSCCFLQKFVLVNPYWRWKNNGLFRQTLFVSTTCFVVVGRR